MCGIAVTLAGRFEFSGLRGQTNNDCLSRYLCARKVLVSKAQRVVDGAPHIHLHTRFPLSPHHTLVVLCAPVLVDLGSASTPASFHDILTTRPSPIADFSWGTTGRRAVYRFHVMMGGARGPARSETSKLQSCFIRVDEPGVGLMYECRACRGRFQLRAAYRHLRPGVCTAAGATTQDRVPVALAPSPRVQSDDRSGASPLSGEGEDPSARTPHTWALVCILDHP